MEFNQLGDDAAEQFELAQAVSFADLAKQEQLQTQILQSQKQYTDCFDKLFNNGKKFTLHRFNWHHSTNGNFAASIFDFLQTDSNSYISHKETKSEKIH